MYWIFDAGVVDVLFDTIHSVKPLSLITVRLTSIDHPQIEGAYLSSVNTGPWLVFLVVH